MAQARRIGEQGRYELIEEIESGGMGTVWRGYDAVLDLRRSIGVLLFSEGRRTEAEGVLDALHEDMCVLLGEDHEETHEIADLLARLHRPEGSGPY